MTEEILHWKLDKFVAGIVAMWRELNVEKGKT